MHIETIGYITIKQVQRDKLDSWIEEFKLCTYDSHEEEIITDFTPEALEAIKGDLITEEEYNKILEKCDVIKFYY